MLSDTIDNIRLLTEVPLNTSGAPCPDATCVSLLLNSPRFLLRILCFCFGAGDVKMLGGQRLRTTQMAARLVTWMLMTTSRPVQIRTFVHSHAGFTELPNVTVIYNRT